MKTFYPLVVFLVLVVFFEGLFFAFMAISYTRRVEDARIREEFLAHCIREGVSNYLSSVVRVPTNAPAAVASSPDIKPTVYFVDLSTWISPRFGYLCSINGNRYRSGDYTEYGLIVRILDGRVFCRDGSEFVILRRSPSSPAVAGPRQRPRSGEDEGGGEVRAF